MIDLAECVRLACLWEARARKAGNVHPEAAFPDLTFADFQMSADAIAPVFEEHRANPIGITVLEAIRATRRVVSTNTNLGIVLLLAPLSKVVPPITRAKVDTVLQGTTIDDARHVYEAIRLANPGGLGKVENQDVATEPTLNLCDAMALAADRDLIARQYANGFREVLHRGLPALMEGLRFFNTVERAILYTQVELLSHLPDSLIVRKYGVSIADEVSRRASDIDLMAENGFDQYARFDRFLRSYRLNPGATADLIAACLFTALRERRLTSQTPFE